MLDALRAVGIPAVDEAFAARGAGRCFSSFSPPPPHAAAAATAAATAAAEETAAATATTGDTAAETAEKKKEGGSDLLIQSTNDEILARLSHFPAVQALRHYRKAAKAIGAFVDKLPQHINPFTGKIHCSLHQCGAGSGRFSCDSPNLQQIPRERRFRCCFVPSSRRQRDAARRAAVSGAGSSKKEAEEERKRKQTGEDSADEEGGEETIEEMKEDEESMKKDGAVTQTEEGKTTAGVQERVEQKANVAAKQDKEEREKQRQQQRDEEDDDRVFVIADFSQIELRIAADLARDPRMIQAYQKGEDLHCVTASLILQKEICLLSKADRQLAKAVNFGLIYGMSAERFKKYAATAYGVSMTLLQARNFHKAYFSSYPGISMWHRMHRVEHPIESRTRAGRRAVFDRFAFTKSLNYPVQGTSADITKESLILLQPKLAAVDGRLVMCVHDEIIAEVPRQNAQEGLRILVSTMEEAGNKYLRHVPCVAEGAIAASWADKA